MNELCTLIDQCTAGAGGANSAHNLNEPPNCSLFFAHSPHHFFVARRTDRFVLGRSSDPGFSARANRSASGASLTAAF